MGRMPASTSRAVLALVLLSSPAVSAPAAALTVPLAGWAAVNGDTRQWSDQTGACLLREESHGQAFPVFTRPEDAYAFATRLQKSLTSQGKAQNVRNVVTQPVERSGMWGVLAAYNFQAGNVEYQVSQLYLSDRGLLRTVTGSSALGDYRECVNTMREFIRNSVN